MKRRRLVRALQETLADGRVEAGRTSSWITRSIRRAGVPFALARAMLADLLIEPIVREGFMDRLRHDISYSIRRLRRAPGFTLVAVLTLALGIGANTAIFSVVNGYLFKTLPIPNLDRMIAVDALVEGFTSGIGLTGGERQAIADAHLDGVECLASTTFIHGVLSAPGRAEVIMGEAVSGDYFRIAGVLPSAGRLFSAADDGPERGGEVVLSDHLWQRLFNRDPNAIGRAIKVTGQTVTIVGVVPDSFHGSWLPTLLNIDVWVPIRDAITLNGELPASGARVPPPADSHYRTFALLRPDANPERSGAAIDAWGRHFPFVHAGADRKEVGLVAAPARERIVPEAFDRYGKQFGAALVALSGLVLLIACGNLTNLLLARASSRSTEVAVRMATGAGRRRIAQLMFVETAIVTILGAVLGLGLAAATVRALEAVPLPQLDGVTVSYQGSLDVHVFIYALLIAAIAAFAVGLVPAWRAASTDPVRVLSQAAGAGPAVPRGRMRQSLIGTQMAASTVLLLAAGLFVRSAMHGGAYNPGFDVDHEAVGQLNLAYNGFDEARGRAYFRRLLDTARNMPGVTAVALATNVPAGTRREISPYLLAEGMTPPQIAGRTASGFDCSIIRASGGLFAALGIPIRRGRDMSVGDVETSEPVVVISESVAAKLWPGLDPIGRRLTLRQDGLLRRVVGLVADTDPRAEFPYQRRFVYVPLEQEYTPRTTMVLRADGTTAAAMTALQSAARAADPDVAIFDVRPVSDQIAVWLAAVRAAAAMMMMLGGLGAAIALVGIYGVTSYVVGLRTREFGILKALGASHAHIYRGVLRSSATMLAAGVVPGLFIAFALAGLLQHVLVGIAPRDPLTFIVVPAALLLVSLAASVVPARRATRVDPNTALRQL